MNTKNAKKSPLPACCPSKYEISHGRSPRGTGMWMFSISGGITDAVTVRGSFTAAKRQAAETFRGKCFRFFVLP